MENINHIPEWAKHAIIYHIYPLGFFNAPKFGKDEQTIVLRLDKIREYYDHLVDLGINIIQFGPLFESERHGYDTIDYFKIDHRLGTNNLFKEIVAELHERDIKVVLDGVFNHVSRDFPSFKDVQTYRENSWRKHWHFINFKKDNPYGDGFDYKNWEGHYNLVKLNLAEPDVKNHLFSMARYWLEEVGIDGWRLDVAYLLPHEFLQEFRNACKAAKPNCLLVGETIHGPYSKWVGPTTLDAATGFQVHKSIWSAFNSRNLYELKAILERSFHPQWGQERDVMLVNFLGNHDTNRISSQLDDARDLYPAVLLLFTLNGIPKIYYGDEIGLLGKKTVTSDDPVRQAMASYPFDLSEENRDLLKHYKRCITLRKNHQALQVGNLVTLHASDHILAFLRQSSQETLLIVISSASQVTSTSIPLWNLGLEARTFVEQLEQGGAKEYRVEQNKIYISEIYPHWGRVLKLE